MDEQDGGQAIPLTTALLNLGQEIRSQARQLGAVEVALGALSSPASGLDSELLRDMQRLDSILQSLFALASFVEGLVPALPQSLTVELSRAVDGIGLSDLRNRLSGREVSLATVEQPLGECELF